MFIFLLCVHVLAAIAGLGPTFPFAFLGIMSEKQPAAAAALQETVLLISTRLVTPLVVILGLSGIGLVIALLGPAGGMGNPEVRKLANGQRIVGMAMGLSVVIVAVLMIWKPGAGA